MNNVSIEQLIKRHRFSNSSGAVIPLHHAFITASQAKFTRINALLLSIILMIITWNYLPEIAQFWSQIMEFFMNKIYDSAVNHMPIEILGHVIYIPIPILEARIASDVMIYGSLIICCFLFFICFFTPSQWMPLSYITRAALIIQASASIDRILSPDYFPYTLQAYIADVMTLSLYLIFLIPAILGFIYYIFPLAWWRKIIMSIVMIAYFIVAIPFQYTLHAIIINEWTLLFLPLLYLLFGVLLDVFMFISLYSIGITWRGDDSAAMSGRS